MLLQTSVRYRLYIQEGCSSRLGAGRLYKPAGIRREHLDVDTQDYSLSCILKGKVCYRHADTELMLGPGEIFQRKPGVLHSTIWDGKSDFLEAFILFPRPVWLAFDALGLIPRPLHFSVQNMDLLHTSIQLVMQSMQSGDDDWHHQTLIEMHKLLARINRMISLGDRSLLDRVKEMQDMLQKDFQTPLPEIAAACGVHYDRLRRAFTRQIGMTPGAYRIRARINEAMNLLKNTPLSVSQIALALGYANIYSFSRQFAKETAQSPTSFRDQIE